MRATWDNVIPPTAWEYNITLRFEADGPDEARNIALQKLESLAVRLSFFISVPVQIVSYGNISNAPELPVKGTQYTTITFVSQHAMQRTDTIIDEKHVQQLADLLLSERFIPVGSERIERSMRWLQHSRMSRTPTDEFMCLIIAFENLGYLLSNPIPRYWRCASCGQITESCPKCGRSTEWQGSNNLVMEDFVCGTLNWTKQKWQKVWKLRNKILHGASDLTASDQLEIIDHVTDLEGAVINAVRHLLAIPHTSPPHTLRLRMPMSNAFMVTHWTA